MSILDLPSEPVALRLAEIRGARQAVLREVDGLDLELGARRPDDGGWSLQQVVEHLVLAERGGFDLIWKAAEAFRAGTPVWSGESENAGLPIETIVERTWQPKEKAPPSAEPTGSGSLGSWAAHLYACDALLERLPAHLEGLPLREVIYPHVLSGPLDALQRLEFIRFHMDHHLPRIRRLSASEAG